MGILQRLVMFRFKKTGEVCPSIVGGIFGHKFTEWRFFEDKSFCGYFIYEARFCYRCMRIKTRSQYYYPMNEKLSHNENMRNIYEIIKGLREANK